MLKLTKRDEKRRDEIVDDLVGAKEEAEAAWAKVEEAIGEYNAGLAKFNEALNEAEGWRADMEAEMAQYESERGDRWREGDNGTAYIEWHGQYEEVDFSTEAEELVVDDPTGALEDRIDNLRNLPSEPNG